MTPSGFELEGRRAIVTGASAGIGAAIAARLAQAGATVMAVSRSGDVPSGTDVLSLVADLTDPAQLDLVIERAVEKLGGLDILVNNAGRSEWRQVTELDRGYFDALIDLNLWAPLRLCQLAHPHLAVAQDAAVVMIGSVDAIRPSAGGALYGATKAGLGAATVALAKEWSGDGIRVTQVDPGLVDTPMTKEIVAALNADDAVVNLVGRVGAADEIAALVHYLVSPVGRFATGTSFRVDGGALVMGPFDTWQSADPS